MRQHRGLQLIEVNRRGSCQGCGFPHGKVLVLLLILLPSLLAVVGLVLDGGVMMDEYRGLQGATDAAATAAATDLRLGRTASVATATANDFVKSANGYADAIVTVHIPPTTGAYAGQSDHIEVIARRNYQTRFTKVIDGIVDRGIETRSVAGVRDATAGAAIVVLDPDPADLSLAGLDTLLSGVSVSGLASAAIPQTGAGTYLSTVPVIGPIVAGLVNSSLTSMLPGQITGLQSDVLSSVSLPALPSLAAGLEVEGVGTLSVDGAILVNNSWGGVDENGELAGSVASPPYGVSCMPLLPTTLVKARDVRVVGGVDDRDFYTAFANGDKGPLQANRLPVPDPYAGVSAPSTTSAGALVSTTVQSPAHCVRIALPTSQANQLTTGVLNSLSALLKPLFTPLIGQLTTLLTQPTLQPGVYDSITVLSPLGGASFSPGVYIIRGKSPLTQMSLCILGPVQADGVLFYITDSASYSASTGQPDDGENSDAPPANPISSLVPSAVIVPLLSTSSISGLNAPSSSLDGMLIFQRRLDRRPIILEAQQLVGGQIHGTVYAKWAHVTFLGGGGSYDLKFVCGSLRIATVLNTIIAPTDLLPPAQDVFLLE
jgi:hypothetical protein